MPAPATSTQQYKPWPRVQFRTNANLTNATVTGAAPAPGVLTPNLSATIDLPFGLRVMDFASTYSANLLIRLTDQFRRRWYGTEDQYVALRAMSQYPGSGVPAPWRYGRVLDNPTLLYSDPTSPFTNSRPDTLLTVNVVKTIGANRELSLAAICIGNWWNDNITYPDYLKPDPSKSEDFWKMAQTIAVEHFAPFPIVLGPAAPGGQTTSVVTLDAPGDLFLYGCYYTGGNNILVEVNRANQNTSAGLTTNPLRIDLLGPTNGNQAGWHWPGMFFVKYGDQLQVTVTSMTPLADINESLVFVGKRIDPYDMERYIAMMQWPADYFRTPVGNPG